MSIQLQLRRGTTTEHAAFTGAVGEVTVDTTKEVAVVHDGSKLGGFPLQGELAIQANGTAVTAQPMALNFTGGGTVSVTSGVVTVTIPEGFSSDIIDLGSF